MYIKDGIAYADKETPMLRVSGVHPLSDYVLRLRFNNGEMRQFDFKPLLKVPAFKPLVDRRLFDKVYIDGGTTVWDGGNIDIAPEYLYENGTAIGTDLYA